MKVGEEWSLAAAGRKPPEPVEAIPQVIIELAGEIAFRLGDDGWISQSKWRG